MPLPARGGRQLRSWTGPTRFVGNTLAQLAKVIQSILRTWASCSSLVSGMFGVGAVVGVDPHAQAGLCEDLADAKDGAGDSVAAASKPLGDGLDRVSFTEAAADDLVSLAEPLHRRRQVHSQVHRFGPGDMLGPNKTR